MEEKTWHYVYGVVYEPLAVDTDGETMTAEAVRAAAHDFLASGRVANIDLEHNGKVCGAQVVESFIARKGDPDYPEGAWVLGVRIPDGPVWEAIKDGRLNGFSLFGEVQRVAVRGVTVTQARTVVGKTEENTDGLVPPHVHGFVIEFDDDGVIVFGMTDEAMDHRHEIRGTVVTEEAAGHSHRFFAV